MSGGRGRLGNLPESDVRADGFRDAVAAAGELETGGDGDGVFDGLRGAVAGGREVGVGGVADLEDARARGRPAGLGVAPEEFEVDDGVPGGGLDEFFEDGRPRFGADALVHLVEDFLGVDGVAPVLG
jgi:hypothetical protein